MTITVTWAKYLQDLPNYQNIVTDEKYLATWNDYLKTNECNIPKDDLIVIPNKVLIKNQSMILDYLLINRSDKVIKDIEMNITLSIFEKEYFTGYLRTTKDSYGDLDSNEARLDLIEFGNDRYENQEINSKDFKLTVYSCRAIEYISTGKEVAQGFKNA